MNKDLLKQIQSACVEKGEEVGFQFFIKCPSCNEEFYSEFVLYKGTKLKALFRKDNDLNQEWNEQKRKAFQEAGEFFDDTFVYCDECDKYVCPDCYVAERGMCLKCCTESAKRVLDEGWHMAHSNSEALKQCPKCGAKVGTAKFCPKCGAKQKVKGICEHCSARIPEEALFCPECGKKV